MALKVKRETKKVTTPIGIAVYPRLNTPDTKFKDEGAYKVDLRLEGDDAIAFKQVAEEFAEEKYREACDAAPTNNGKKAKIKRGQYFLPFKEVEDDQGNTVPDQIDVKFRLKASGTSKKTGESWKRKPTVVDAAKQPVTEIVGGGSKIRVAGLLKTYFTPSLGFGVSAELRAVQVIELVEYQGGGDFTNEFDEEDGFTSSQQSSNTAAVESGDSDDDEDGADF